VKTGHKVLIGIGIYGAIGLAYAIANWELYLRNGMTSNRFFVGFHGASGDTSNALFWTEAIAMWPVALPYGLFAGDPRFVSGGESSSAP
jgi:hypothetical protein